MAVLYQKDKGIFTQFYYIPATPKILPIPYVTAIASAPPETTLATAFGILAPPTSALIVPVIASAIITDIKAAGIRIDSGGTVIAISGIRDPIKNEIADAAAA